MALALGRLFDRAFLGPVLLLNFVLYVLVLGIAGWILDSTIQPPLNVIYMNAASKDFSVFSLIAGMVGLASIFGGLRLLKDWRQDTNISANMSCSLIAWFLLLLAFGLACKEIHIGGVGTSLKFMEAFVIILTLTQGIYVMLLHGRALVSLPI